jgi:WD40 repeat protein
LGWPKSTVIHRLARARQRLRQRLTGRGLEVPASLLAAVLAGEAAAARVPALLTLATVRLARRGAAGAEITRLAGRAAGGVSVARWIVVFGLAGAFGLAAGAGAFLALAETQAPPPAAPAPPAKVADPGPRKDRDGIPLPDEALAQVGSLRLRHGPGCHHFEYSPDGALLATSGGGWVRLWEAATGKLVREIAVRGRGEIPDGFFSADGKTVLAYDGEVCRWYDVRTGQEVRHLRLPNAGKQARFAPHGEMLAVPQAGPVGDLTFSVTELVVYDLPSGKERFRRLARTSWTGEVTFSPDGKLLAALDGFQVRLFDTEAGRFLGEFDSGGDRGLAFAPDGKKILGLDREMNIRVWDVPAGKTLGRISGDAIAKPAPPFNPAFTPDGKSIVTVTKGIHWGQIDLATGEEVRRFPPLFSADQVIFSPDGKTLAAGSFGSIMQWDLATGRQLAASCVILPGIPQLRFDERSRLLWVGCLDYAATDWRSGKVVRRVDIPGVWEGRPHVVSPDGSRQVCFRTDDTSFMRDVATGKELCTLPVPLRYGCLPVFSPDGKTLYTTVRDGPIQAWEVDTGKELAAVDKQRSLTTLALSPDGRRLAAVDVGPLEENGRREIVVRDLPGRRTLCRLLPPGEARAFRVAFSPDGNALAAVGADTRIGDGYKSGFVALWDLRTGECKFARTGLSGILPYVAFSGDGRALVTGGYTLFVGGSTWDLCLWEVATGQERHHFTGHEGVILDVAFSADGKLVAAASGFGSVLVWDVTGCYDKPPSKVPFSASEANDLWDTLGDKNSANAFTTMRRLLRRPGPAVALLRGRLKPAPGVDEKVVRRLLRELESDDFATREKATKELEAVAYRDDFKLLEALAANPPPETRQRIQHILESAGPPSSERWRHLRAVEVLEHIGSSEAREVLAALAKNKEESLLKREARAAVERLKGR